MGSRLSLWILHYTRIIHKYTKYTNVHNSSIHSRQNMKTTQMSLTGEWISEISYPHEGCCLSTERSKLPTLNPEYKVLEELDTEGHMACESSLTNR